MNTVRVTPWPRHPGIAHAHDHLHPTATSARAAELDHLHLILRRWHNAEAGFAESLREDVRILLQRHRHLADRRHELIEQIHQRFHDLRVGLTLRWAFFCIAGVERIEQLRRCEKMIHNCGKIPHCCASAQILDKTAESAL